MMVLYPLLMAVMLFDVDTAVTLFEDGKDIKDNLWLRCLLAAFAVLSGFLLPSLFNAVYFLNRDGVMTWVLLGLFVLSAPGVRIAVRFLIPEDVR